MSRRTGQNCQLECCRRFGPPVLRPGNGLASLDMSVAFAGSREHHPLDVFYAGDTKPQTWVQFTFIILQVGKL